MSRHSHLRDARYVVPTAFALCIERFGAISAHFHNYFAKGLPIPFGNSLDALRMLILLGFVAITAFHVEDVPAW
jgi:hypothetical protein